MIEGWIGDLTYVTFLLLPLGWWNDIHVCKAY